MFAEQYASYRAFISSPSDVAAERQLAEETIQSINMACFETLKASVTARKWEHLPPESPHLPEEKIQDLINREVEKAHFFVLILYKRYGRTEPGHSKSNTERELDTILKRFETNPQIRILAYFREIPGNADPGDQETKVTEFRHRLETLGIRYQVYKDPIHFKDLFTHHMYTVFLRMCLSPYKQLALRRFWRIGETNRPTYPRLAILIPPVSRGYVYPNDDKIWLDRLEPNINFEDYKAIHKIKKLLSLIGFHSYKAFFHTDLPGDLQFMNKVWICFPRSEAALRSLNTHAREVRFRLNYRREAPTQLEWRGSNGNTFYITSPLSAYLNEQRGGMDRTGELTAPMRKIIAKDYAVLARFRNEESSELTDEGFLYDYYFAGIRGLGTWGAAWFVDRKAKLFLDYPEEDNIQIVLEVMYKNGGISDVFDVSHQSAEYFAEQNSLDFIRDQIRLFNE